MPTVIPPPPKPFAGYTPSYAPQGVPVTHPGYAPYNVPTTHPAPSYAPTTPPISFSGPTGSPGGNQGGPTPGWAGQPVNQAQVLADQYNAWLTSQQSRLTGDLQTNIGLANQTAALNARGLQDSYANQLGLNRESALQNQLDIQGLGGQAAYLGGQKDIAARTFANDSNYTNEQWQLRTGQWTNQQEYINKVWGLATQQLGQERKYIGQLQDLAGQQNASDQAYYGSEGQRLGLNYGFNEKDYANQLAGIAQTESTNNRAAKSDATARGAFTSQGFFDNLGDIRNIAKIGRDTSLNTFESNKSGITGAIAANTKRGIDARAAYDVNVAGYANQLAQSQNQYATGVAGFQNQLKQGQNAYEADVSGYRHNLTGQQIQYDSTIQGLDKQLKDNSLAKQGLESIARQYGIKATDLNQQLNTKLRQNGLDQAKFITQLNQAYATNDSALVQQMTQFMGSLIGIK